MPKGKKIIIAEGKGYAKKGAVRRVDKIRDGVIVEFTVTAANNNSYPVGTKGEVTLTTFKQWVKG